MPKPPLLDNAGPNPYAAPPSATSPPSARPVADNPYRAPAADLRSAAFPAEKRGLLPLLFSFSGRVGRGTFWLIGIGSALVFYLAIFLAVTNVGEEAAGALLLLLYVPLVWISLANSAKRWHDRNKSGWWILIAFVPLIGPFWAFIEQGFLPGDRSPNRFGPPPG